MQAADAALATAKAQMGRGCTDESTGDAAAEAQLDEEDWEWLDALGAAKAPLLPRPAGTVDPPPGKKEAPRPALGPPLIKGAQRDTGAETGKGVVAPRTGGPATRGARLPEGARSPEGAWPPEGPPPGGSPAAPAARGGKKRTRSRC